MLTRSFSGLPKPLQDVLRSAYPIGKNLIGVCEIIDIDWDLYGRHLRGAAVERYRRGTIKDAIRREFKVELKRAKRRDFAALYADDNFMRRYWARRVADGVQQNTINRERVIIRAVFNRAWERKQKGFAGRHNTLDWALPLENPGASIPSMDETEFDRKRVVEPEEWVTVKPLCSQKLVNRSLMALWTGLSRNDLKALRKSKHVNKITGCLEGVRLKTITPRNPNGKWYRIRITPQMHGIIDAAEGDLILDFTYEKELPRVVKRWLRGPPIYYQALRKALPREHFQSKDFRRSAGVQLENRGIKRSTIQRFYAHRYSSTTDRYLFSTDPAVDSAVMVLAEVYT